MAWLLRANSTGGSQNLQSVAFRLFPGAQSAGRGDILAQFSTALFAWPSMPTRNYAVMQRLRPGWLFLLVLSSAFTSEVVVMVVLPYFLPAQSSFSSAALIDACLLTVLLAPLLWWLVVKPLRKVADARQQLLSFAMSAQENERRRIAGELHDGLGQVLTCLLVGLRTIEELSSDEQVRLQAGELRRIGGEAHDEIRRLARGLRPAVLDDAGLVPALERFLQDVRASHKVEANLILACDEPPRLSSDVETTLYRMVQEGVTNAIRHGAATKIGVTMRCSPRAVEVSIEDDGSGFDPGRTLRGNADNQPFGLLSIRERAELAGGVVAIESTPGVGSRLQVRVPIADTEPRHA